MYGAQEGESTPHKPLLFKQRVLSYWGPDLVQKIQKRQSAPSISSSEDPTFLLLLRGWKKSKRKSAVKQTLEGIHKSTEDILF